MFKRISVDPKVSHGQVCIKGTRIPVYQIVQMIANGDSIADLLEAYPTIRKDDIRECLEYAAYLTQEQLTPIESLSV
ncbi:MAG: DUF433 domain-containing protein [bacterium]|nr:DUF433 domain-containing protein [bacterium]